MQIPDLETAEEWALKKYEAEKKQQTTPTSASLEIFLATISTTKHVAEDKPGISTAKICRSALARRKDA
jgi:hypothetical protein